MTRGSIRTILIAAIAALITAGATFAFAHVGHHGGFGYGPGKNLTYAEFHTFKDGKSETYRLDVGNVKSADGNSITITERDGDDVTIPVDSNTRVFSYEHYSSVAGIDAGEKVLVYREEGGPAAYVKVLGGHHHGQYEGAHCFRHFGCH